MPLALARLISVLAVVVLSGARLAVRLSSARWRLLGGIAIGVLLFVLGRGGGAAWRYTLAAPQFLANGTPVTVGAGIPFVVHDSYATQVCVSSGSGRLLTPIVVSPQDPVLLSTYFRNKAQVVTADLPFVVRDAHGTQICISSRGGKALPPLVAP